MYNVGIIGFGKMGRTRASAIEQSGRGRVQKVYDVQTDDSLKYQWAHNEEEIINDSTIDVIVIATPNHCNKPLTIAALKAGKHVFCEKPPALSAQDVRDIKKVEDKAQKILMYGFNHRHHRIA